MKSWRITVCKNVRDDYFEHRNSRDYFFINEIYIQLYLVIYIGVIIWYCIENFVVFVIK